MISKNKKSPVSKRNRALSLVFVFISLLGPEYFQDPWAQPIWWQALSFSFQMAKPPSEK